MRTYIVLVIVLLVGGYTIDHFYPGMTMRDPLAALSTVLLIFLGVAIDLWLSKGGKRE